MVISMEDGMYLAASRSSNPGAKAVGKSGDMAKAVTGYSFPPRLATDLSGPQTPAGESLQTVDEAL